MFAALLAVAVLAIALACPDGGPVLAPFGLALGVFVMAGAVSELAFRIALGNVPLAEAWRRLKSQPRSAFGTTLAHFGVGMLVVGIVATSAYREERILVMKPGEQVTARRLHARLPRRGAGNGAQLPRGGRPVRRLARGRRRSRGSSRPSASTTRRRSRRRRPASMPPGAAISTWSWAMRRRAAAMRCASISIRSCASSGSARLSCSCGGGVSLSDRRLRVGAPGRARRLAAAPAE